MDLAPLQQTVKEISEASVHSFPQELDSPSASSPTSNTYELHSYDEVFRVPYEERAKIDGNSQFGESASSRICADIASRTGTLIEISSAKDQSLTFLVTGKSDTVQNAKRLVLDKFQTQAKQAVRIPKEHHRFVLGKKGKKLQELEVQTGTKIHVPHINDASEDIAVLGTKDGIERAVHEIRLISDEQSKKAYEKIDIPKIYHPFIAGAFGERVNNLNIKYNVRVNLPPASVDDTEITITGEKEGVMKVRELLQKEHKDMVKKFTFVSVEVKKSQHKYVEGQKGANIAEILQLTGVSVDIPPPDSLTDTVTLRGPQEKLGEALTMVYEKANSITTAEVEAPVWLRKFIIGSKGVNIKQFTQSFPEVHIEFSHKEDNVIVRLEGPPGQVEMASEKMEELIKDLSSKLTFEELPVDSRFFKHIIGRNGSNINRIREESGVAIFITNMDGNDVIRLEGAHDAVINVKKELKEMINKMENEKEHDVVIEQRFHRTIIGTKGEKVKEIRDKYNQVQISFPDAGERSDVVKVRGEKQDVDHCVKYLKKLHKELLEENYQVHVSIYRQNHKFVIGKGGANIKKIKEETCTRIDLPSEFQNSDEIIITGRKENCEKAKEMINKIQNDLANSMETYLIIPAKFHNALIGAKGKLIQGVSEECGGVLIKFPPPESKSEKVTIRGPKDDVIKAKKMLVDLCNEKKLSSYTEEIKAKPQHHRFLIGRKGANIQKIRDSTGTRIIFPTDDDENKEIITVIGKEEDVKKARKLLEATIKDLENIVENVMRVDRKYHSHFVARKGELLHQIADQYGGVSISFPRSGEDSDQVILKGAKECVEGAKTRINEIMSDLIQRVTLEVIIPQTYHRTVMGARGFKVQNISAEHSVQIKFPEREEIVEMNGSLYDDGSIRPQDTVRVIGKRENCEAAKQALMELVPTTEEIEVPFRHHKFIIGQRGEAVRNLMSEFDVNVQVPPAGDKSDVIRVTGIRSSVEAAKAALLEKVALLEEEEVDRKAKAFKVKVEVDPAYHPKIIGRKGINVTKIREKFDVNVQFPTKGEPNDHIITITGYEKNALAARDHILSITGDYKSVVKVSVEVDSRVHSRLIGAKGRAIRKIMEDYKVNVSFPRGGDDPNLVTITGTEESVESCKDHLLNLEEEFLQDIKDQEDMSHYMSPQDECSKGDKDAKSLDGFVVTGAPWAQKTPNMNSAEDFPSIGKTFSHVSPPVESPIWGPKR